MEIIYNENKNFSKKNLSTVRDLSVLPTNYYILHRIGGRVDWQSELRENALCVI